VRARGDAVSGVRLAVWVGRVPLIVTALIAGVVLASHLASVHQCDLPQFGDTGAEYIEHQARQDALERVSGVGWLSQILLLPHHLSQLDGEYPALHHLLAACWGSLFGKGVAASVHLNLVFLAMLAVATAVVAHRIATVWTPEGTGRQPWTVALALVSLLACPAIFATARRYYYDLPMAAWCTVALAAVLLIPRSRGAGAVAAIAAACALMTKWTAGFYVVSVWGLGLAQLLWPTWKGERARPALQLLLAGGLALMLCLPAILQSAAGTSAVSSAAEMVGVQWEAGEKIHGSLDHVVAQGARSDRLGLGSAEGRREFVSRLRFYSVGLFRSSVGPLLVLALVVCAGAGRRGWRALAVSAAMAVIPLLLLVAWVGIRDERFLVPMLPWFAAALGAAWSTCRTQAVRVGTLVAVALVAVLQVTAVDGRLPLPDAFIPRSPTEQRGWNRAGEIPCSPHEEIETFARAACGPAQRGGMVWIEGPVAVHHGLQLYLDRQCPRGAVLRGATVPATPRDAVEPGTPLSVITARDLPDPWPTAHRDIELNMRGAVRVYLVTLESP